jgi:hypothetical protein
MEGEEVRQCLGGGGQGCGSSIQAQSLQDASLEQADVLIDQGLVEASSNLPHCTMTPPACQAMLPTRLTAHWEQWDGLPGPSGKQAGLDASR